MSGPATSRARCATAKLCHYIVFDNKTTRAIEDRIGRCDEGKPKPKKNPPATFSWSK
jgi:hypothetical protein